MSDAPYVDQVLANGRQRPSKHGAALGAALAHVADYMAPQHPEIPERCKTCAFRLGTVPNQLAGTLVEALRCVSGADPAPFGCHQTLGPNGLPEHLCSGYLLARLANRDEVRRAVLVVVDDLEMLVGMQAEIDATGHVSKADLNAMANAEPEDTRP